MDNLLIAGGIAWILALAGGSTLAYLCGYANGYEKGQADERELRRVGKTAVAEVAGSKWTGGAK